MITIPIMRNQGKKIPNYCEFKSLVNYIKKTKGKIKNNITVIKNKSNRKNVIFT